MTKVNVLEQEIMEARIDELRRQVHALERQLVLSNQRRPLCPTCHPVGIKTISPT